MHCRRAKLFFLFWEIAALLHFRTTQKLQWSCFLCGFSQTFHFHIFLHLFIDTAMPGRLKKNFTSFEKKKKTMIHFCCLFALQQMASPKPWMKNLMYHIFHIFFILQTIMLQVTSLHTDNKKNNLSIISFGKQFVSENKIAFKKKHRYVHASYLS